MIEIDDEDTPLMVEQRIRARKNGVTFEQQVKYETGVLRAQQALHQIKVMYEDYRDRRHHSLAEQYGSWLVALQDFVPTKID